MKDVECAETEEKSIFRFFLFLFFELSWKFIEKFGWFEYKNEHNSKKSEIWFFLWLSRLHIFAYKFEHYWKKIFWKKKIIILVDNRKIYFSFDSAHCASFMKVESKLSGGGLHILSWDRARITHKSPKWYDISLRCYTLPALTLRHLLNSCSDVFGREGGILPPPFDPCLSRRYQKNRHLADVKTFWRLLFHASSPFFEIKKGRHEKKGVGGFTELYTPLNIWIWWRWMFTYRNNSPSGWCLKIPYKKRSSKTEYYVLRIQTGKMYIGCL